MIATSPAADVRKADALLLAGQLDQAARLYMSVLHAGIADPSAYVGLARVALHRGRFDDAVQLAASAIQRAPRDAEAFYVLGRARRSVGDLDGAIDAYQAALDIATGRADILVSLAIALRATGRQDEAIAAYRKAIELAPDMVEAHHNLANVLAERGAIDEAEAGYRRALALAPTFAESHFELGNLAQRRGNREQAEACYRQATESNPNHARAWLEWARLAFAAGDGALALERLQSIVRRWPDFVEALVLLATVLESVNRIDEAIAALDRFVALAPDRVPPRARQVELLRQRGEHERALAVLAAYPGQLSETPELLSVQGRVYTDLFRTVEARASFERALQLRPDDAWCNLQAGNVCAIMGELGLAIERLRRARELDPDIPETSYFLGGAYLGASMADEAAACFAESGSRFDEPQLHRSLCCAVNYLDHHDAQSVLRQHVDFGNRYGIEAAHRRSHANAADPDRPLRIGYLSPDLRQHSVARFIEPVLRSHDRRRFEIVAYFNCHRGDEVSDRLRGLCTDWVPTARMTDAELDARIVADGIDILIDLAGHTSDNRLLAMARRPAPVQMTWLGYPTTTGLPGIDYRITDWRVDPPGHEAFQSERPIRLPGVCLCFTAPPEAPEVGPPPAASSGAITFGSFNNLAKLSPGCLSLWSAVLQAVPGARLLIKAYTDAFVREHLLARFAEAGVGAERIVFHGWQERVENHLAAYGAVDIALDSWPYNGVTTSCEAMWMGVPVVSLCGQTHASRFGRSLLEAVGLPQLALDNREDFVEACVALAGDRPRLHDLRSSLRERMRTSPLMDEARFTRDLESAYRTAWARWCEASAGVSLTFANA